MEKNYGVDIEKEKRDRTETDWILGAETPTCMVEEASGMVTASFAWPAQWKGVYPRTEGRFNHCWIFFQRSLAKYFPVGQIQNWGSEKMDCVTRGFNNELEKKLNYAYQTQKFHQPFIKFLTDYGFFDSEGKIRLSNRVPAKMSGTTENGNSLKAVINCISNIGIFPQSILPEDQSMSWKEYYDATKITEEILNVGKKSLEYLTINYAIIDKLSEYPKYSDNIKWEAFDNYIDSFDGDYVKRLAENYIIMDYGYKLIINELKKNNKTMLQRKRGEEKVHLILENGKNYWIKTAEDFEGLKSSQPITGIYWDQVQEVDELSSPWDGKSIIGQQIDKKGILQAITALFNTLFGKKK